MFHRAILAALMIMTTSFFMVHAAGAQSKFFRSVDKATKLSGQMVRGVVPFQAVKANKAMKSIHDAAELYLSQNTGGGDVKVINCAKKLKVSSTKAMNAAQYGQGAFQAAFSEIIQNYKTCK